MSNIVSLSVARRSSIAGRRGQNRKSPTLRLNTVTSLRFAVAAGGVSVAKIIDKK